MPQMRRHLLIRGGRGVISGTLSQSWRAFFYFISTAVWISDCCASDTNLQRLERVQLSAARIITGLRNSCPKAIVIYEANLQSLSLRRIPNLVVYCNKLYSLDSPNRTSAYLKDWCNNQRHKRNSLFSQVTSCNLITNTVEQHHLTQSIDPTARLPGVFFHTNLPVHVNKQKDHPTYLRQLALKYLMIFQ
ncbi:hypothetical protein AVEN_165891-1 [Araneus ventricosus]|uniref:Uncharacterized protein n=1 Tax=Araneus ventricosus TaxID=182803 RepID=A0A4Y2J976_ARAVE|nr:hypothetical protein AVEN_165891-1 [Araneus ventricosus]